MIFFSAKKLFKKFDFLPRQFQNKNIQLDVIIYDIMVFGSSKEFIFENSAVIDHFI